MIDGDIAQLGTDWPTLVAEMKSLLLPWSMTSLEAKVQITNDLPPWLQEFDAFSQPDTWGSIYTGNLGDRLNDLWLSGFSNMRPAGDSLSGWMGDMSVAPFETPLGQRLREQLAGDFEALAAKAKQPAAESEPVTANSLTTLTERYPTIMAGLMRALDLVERMLGNTPSRKEENPPMA